jgi:UDP-3-O-[3-hydroxymyristoyl] glucosamine N-acyltransferase
MTGFVKPNCQLTVGEIAALTHAKLRDGDPAGRRISNIAPLDSASLSDINFLDNPKYLDAFANTRAGACLTAPRFAASARARTSGDTASLFCVRRGHAQTVLGDAASVVAVRHQRPRG